MRRSFHIAGPAHSVWLGLDDDSPRHGGEEIPATLASGMVESWFAPLGGARSLLASICRELGVEPSGMHLTNDIELRTVVVRAIERGRLRAYRLPKPVFRALEKVELEEYVPEELGPQPEVETTWIAIQLLDDDQPPSPVPFETYEIELDDGTIKSGQTDKTGMARVDGIPKGNAKVRFPKLDAEAWRKL